MSQIQDAYWNALLADATYALEVNDDNIGGQDLIDDLKSRMTQPIAEHIAGDFTVVTHIDTDDVSGSGFDATVWRRSDGKLYVSMTGTQPGGIQDFLTDAQLALTGDAGDQVVDMINWWFKITTPVGQQARQIQVNVILIDESVQYELGEAATVAGAGLISAADLAAGIEVNGHSLGGYLASAFTRLFGEQANITHVTTFNSAGFAPGSEQVFKQYEDIIGPGYGLGRFPNASEQDNYFAANGINVTTNTFWFNQIGQRASLFNEEGTSIPNHLIYKLTDSLGLISALETLDPSMSFDRSKLLFGAGSNSMDASLEGVLDGLVRMLVSANATPTLIGDVGDSALSRLDYHTSLSVLTTVGEFQALSGKLHVSESSRVLATEAKNEFSALVALQVLSPVVLRGTDTANQTLLNTTLGSIHTDLYTQWQADQALSIADRAAGKANFSDAWLSDRAAMLNIIVQRNKTDEDDPLSANLSGGARREYIDLATGTHVETGSGSAVRSQIVFGSGADDSIYGSAAGDRLYGGSGADQLYGEAGDDYLEGGGGNDTLTSGSGRDVLVGGAGFDAYWISRNAQSIVIRDSDGSGAIVIEKADFSSYTLGANIKEISGSPDYFEDDEGNRYRVSGDNLIVQIVEGSRILTIENFQSMPGAKLGIEFQPPEAPEGSGSPLPNTTNIIDRLDPNSVQGEWVEFRDADLYGTEANDIIYTRSFIGGGGGMIAIDELGGDEVMIGDAGTDQLFGGKNNDWISGGASIDFLYGDRYENAVTDGNDVVEGQAGSDLISGGGGDDQLWADERGDTNTIIAAAEAQASLASRGDFLLAQSGNDFVVGSAGFDVISGGDGEDTLIGGGGNDLINGDASYDALYEIPWNLADNGQFDWGWSIALSQSTGPGGVTVYNAHVADTSPYTDFTPIEPENTTENAKDLIYGGQGDDIIISGHGDDTVDGGVGNDTLFGGIGNDILLGQAGEDYLDGGDDDDIDGIDFLDGGEDDDGLSGGNGGDILYGGTGNDVLYGDDSTVLDGEDYLNGEEGNDTLAGGGLGDVLVGGAGNDNLYGDSTDTLDALQGDDHLYGDGGIDLLVGWGGNDVLYGGADNDQLFGDGSTVSEVRQGSDYLNGGDGDDTMSGDGGSDILVGGTGNDTMFGDSSNTPVAVQGDDYIEGESGDDVILGMGGNDSLMGGAGNDTLFGGNGSEDTAGGNDYLDGGEGGDTLYGGTGNDILRGGAGIDALNGGEGDDTYIYDVDDIRVIDFTREVLVDNAGVNSVIINGLSESDISLASGPSNGDLLIRSGTDIELNIRGALTGAVRALELNGAAVSAAQLVGARYNSYVNQISSSNDSLLLGGTQGDYLYALGQSASLSGGRGNDQLIGSATKKTTYLIEAGDGNDVINDQGNQIVNDELQTNTLIFGAGVESTDLKIEYDNSTFALRLKYSGGVDSVGLSTFSRFNMVGTRTIDEIKFDDGSTLTWEQLIAQQGVDVMASSNTYSIDGTYSNDRIVGTSGNNALYGEQGDDILNGGAGYDDLYGGGGNDTYVFGRDSGYDSIYNDDQTATVDSVWFAPDVSPDDVKFYHVNDSLIARIAGSDGRLLVAGYFATTPIDEFRFADGTVYTPATLTLSDPAEQATDGDDTIWGSPSDDVIDAQNGNDTVYGSNGNDTLRGSGGVDLLYGEGGADVLEGGASNDTLYGGQGDDILVGGVGFDTLEGEQGSDTYQIARGDGEDTIYNVDYTPGAIDVLQFGAGILPSDVKVHQYDSKLELVILNASGAYENFVRIMNYFTAGNETASVDEIRFADAPTVVWTRQDIVDQLLTGTEGNDSITGYATADRLRGLGGDDVLNGLDGNDDLDGGTGNDVMNGGAGDDTYRFAANGGDDRITDTAGIDRIVLGAGVVSGDVQLYKHSQTADGDLVLVIGNTGTQLRISGHFAVGGAKAIESIEFSNGTIWDATQIAAQTVDISGTANSQTGTSSADVFVVDHVNDAVSDSTSGDGDTVQSSVSYTAPMNVENLTLTGLLNLNGTGNASANTITGNQNNNRLDGGAGADILIGGAGDDTYFIEDSGGQYFNSGWSDGSHDTVQEQANEGYDSVVASSYSATLSANVERLVAVNFSGNFYYYYSYEDLRRYFIGNALDNVIDVSASTDGAFGNSRGIVLNGGAGADLMIGGSTDDTYVIDNAGDVIDERGFYPGGTDNSIDTVESGISYVLGAHLENLKLTGAAATSGTGNALANELDGSVNSAANVLTGGAGNDVYTIGAGDSVLENAGEGIDMVKVASGTPQTYSLNDFANVENIWLQNGAGGSNVQGNSAANSIIGNNSGNVLEGGDGDDQITDSGYSDTTYDSDTLLGGNGNDTLTSYRGNDILDGGAGDDSLYQAAGYGWRTYIFGTGYGNDVLYASIAEATLQLTPEVTPDQLEFERDGNGLRISIQGDDGSMFIAGFFSAATGYETPFSGLAEIEFADGTVWDKAQIVNRFRASLGDMPSSGDNFLSGTSSADSIDALAGNDFVFAGSGADTVDGNEGDDELHGDAGDDTLLGSAGMDTLNGGAGNDTLDGGSDDDTLHGNNGVDILTGGSGNDLLRGGAGGDTYRFGLSSGDDVIQDTDDGIAEDTGVDEIVFEAGIAPTDLELSVGGDGYDLVIRNTVTDDTIVYRGVFVPEYYSGRDHLERIRFNDGTIWDQAEIVSRSARIYGTENSDSLNAIEGIGTELYGLGGDDYLSGRSGNDLLDGGSGVDYMFGSTGNDTFIVDNTSDSTIENPGEGIDLVKSSVTRTLGNDLENLTLTGSADINGTGNTLNNILTGNSGNNTLSGGTGADTMAGGAGNDTYIVDNAGDVVTENASEGTDLVQSSISYTLTNDVENLTLTGSSSINGTGNSSANTITGNSGANTLDGGLGNDTLIGGGGNDIYIVDSLSDAVTEGASAGTDTIQTSLGYSLSSLANIENLTLTGSGNVNGTGNAASNTITGNSGDNTLDPGSAGTDVLLGGQGNDTYIVTRSSGITITESANQGTDQVNASVAYTLGSNLENLTLTGTGAINGTGNNLDNILTGNSGNNTLAGGTGADTMAGGQGNDTYVVDNAGDQVTESSAEGTDLVQSSISYALTNNVENLTLTGSSNINGTGNSAVNTITGNSGANTLDGGLGNDTLIGGSGNDIYIVDSASDVVTEGSSAGTDTIQTALTYSLSALTNVENLTLTGTGNVNGTGNAASNTITGNGGDNTLDPGSAGTDVLIGGAGNDTYTVTRTSGITITEAAGAGTDLVNASVAHTLAANVENLTLTGSGNINGTGNTLDNVLTGNSGNNTLTGSGGNDTLNPGTAGTDSMLGGTGDDFYIVDRSTGLTITENANEGIDAINASVATTLGSNIELLFLSGSGNINGTGNTLNNLLRGNTGNNTLAGAAGVDILEGGGGADTVSDTGGNTLLNGGVGTDTLTGTSNNDMLIGGTGNDALTTGQGADIIAFNKGDGQDTVAVSTTKDNTLAVGGGAVYADLLFQKSGNDLILKVGASDQITFTGYYASASNRSVDKLQVVIEGTSDYDSGSGNAMNNKKIETFNFDGLVAAFDTARAANPSLTTWALTDALLTQHLGGSDTAAMGGDLAYRYGRFGTLSDMSFTPAAGILAAAGFGGSAQTLQTLASLQDTSPRLS